MARNSTGSTEAGRGDHLKNLARVFRRRGCDWADFGQFLHWLFYDHESPHRLSDLNCRHDPSNRNHSFNNSRPCQTTGTKDKGKAMKFVSFDLRALARQWCRENGFTLLAVADRQTRNTPCVFPQRHEDGDLSSDDDFVDSAGAGDDDSWAVTVGLGMSRYGVSSPLRSSIEPEEKRVTTGLRVHVLAYLARWWDDSAELEKNWDLLVGTSTSILHLCGCGICHNGDKACTEPSHLRLGTQKENDYHTAWHLAVEHTQSLDEYRLVVGVIQRCPGGQGVI